MTAMLVVAGLAAANPIALFEGGGEAEGEAHGGYYADASGALDAGNDAVGQTAQATAAAHQANDMITKTKYDVWGQAKAVEAPATPECMCDNLTGALDQVGSMDVEHTDSVEKAADLDTEYVNAGADVGAAGSVKGWFKDAFSGVKDAFTSVQALFGVDTSATDDVKAAGDSLIGADDELRGQLVSQLDQHPELPSLDPKLEGSFAGEHATEVTSSALGQVQGSLP